jgi:hypothetical protein
MSDSNEILDEYYKHVDEAIIIVKSFSVLPRLCGESFIHYLNKEMFKSLQIHFIDNITLSYELICQRFNSNNWLVNSYDYSSESSINNPDIKIEKYIISVSPKVSPFININLILSHNTIRGIRGKGVEDYQFTNSRSKEEMWIDFTVVNSGWYRYKKSHVLNIEQGFENYSKFKQKNIAQIFNISNEELTFEDINFLIKPTKQMQQESNIELEETDKYYLFIHKNQPIVNIIHKEFYKKNNLNKEYYDKDYHIADFASCSFSKIKSNLQERYSDSSCGCSSCTQFLQLLCSNFNLEWHDGLLKDKQFLENSIFKIIDKNGFIIKYNEELLQSSTDNLLKYAEDMEKIMSDDRQLLGQKPGFFDKQKNHAVAGAYRAATNQGIQAVKAAILLALSKNGFDQSKLEVAKEIMENQLVDAGVRLAFGIALEQAPMLPKNKKIAKIAEELQVSGYQVGMDHAADLVKEHLLPIVSTILTSLPEDEEILSLEDRKELESLDQKVRVFATPTVSTKQEDAEQSALIEEQAIKEEKVAKVS